MRSRTITALPASLGAVVIALGATLGVALGVAHAARDRRSGPRTPATAAAARPLFGETRIERGRARIAAGRAVAFPFRGLKSGSATSISVFVAAHTRASAVRFGVYADAGGRPGRQLARGTLASIRIGHWASASIRGMHVTARRMYWLALAPGSGQLVVPGRAHGACRSVHAAARVLRARRGRWRSAPRRRGCPISAHATGPSGRGPGGGSDGPLGGGSTGPHGTALGLPAGVALQQIDGGVSYFSHFRNAAGWDASGFYPIAAFNQSLGYTNGNYDASQITAYRHEGINGFVGLYAGYDQSLLGAIKAAGMWVIDQPLAPGYAGTTLNGYVWFDEPETNNRCGDVPSAAILGESVPCAPASNGGTPASVISRVTGDVHGAHGAGDPTRFVYGNFTKPVARNEGLSQAEAAQYLTGVDVVSFDDYIINDGWESNHNLWEQADLVRNVRAETGEHRPVLPFIEAGEPFTSDQWSKITATPAMSVAEAWNAIIGGARGIEWFDHDFGGSSGGYAESADDLIDAKPVFASLQSAVRAFNREVTGLAPVLNAPFATGYVTSTGAMNVMAKYDATSNDLYVFAAPRSNSAQNITFTLAGGYSGPVTVYDENRSVTATNGRFADSFANETAVHVYVIPNS